MYGNLFCRVYNEFGWNEYPRVFGEQLLGWLEQKGMKVRSALDLGCGTGVLCALLHSQGIEAEGVDLSEEMVGIARENAPGLRFTAADMTEYRPSRCFDLVTCTGDAINHVPDLAAVGRTFDNVYEALNPGGCFVFDLLNESEVPEGDGFDLDYSDAIRARFRAERDDRDCVELRVAVYEHGQLKFEETIREKLHDPALIRERLRQSGFEVLQFSDRLLLDSDTHGTTWFVVARRPENS